MADESILKKALNTLKQGQEFVFPHASKNPYAPMAYVKDFNEWFMPSAQMALDEAQGEEDYPAWAYGLASLPVVGKVGKVAGKVAKGAGKAGKKIDWVANRRANRERAVRDYFENMAYLENQNTFKEFNAAERNARWDNAVNYEKMLKAEAQGFVDNAEKYGMNPQHVSDLEDYIYSNDVEGMNKILSMYEDAPSKANAIKSGINAPSPEWTLIKDVNSKDWYNKQQKIANEFSDIMSVQPDDLRDDVVKGLADKYGLSLDEIEFMLQ